MHLPGRRSRALYTIVTLRVVHGRSFFYSEIHCAGSPVCVYACTNLREEQEGRERKLRFW